MRFIPSQSDQRRRRSRQPPVTKPEPEILTGSNPRTIIHRVGTRTIVELCPTTASNPLRESKLLKLIHFDVSLSRWRETEPPPPSCRPRPNELPSNQPALDAFVENAAAKVIPRQAATPSAIRAVLQPPRSSPCAADRLEHDWNRDAIKGRSATTVRPRRVTLYLKFCAASRLGQQRADL